MKNNISIFFLFTGLCLRLIPVNSRVDVAIFLLSLLSLAVFYLLTYKLEFSDNQRILSSLLAGLLPIHFLMMDQPWWFMLAAVLYLTGIVYVVDQKLIMGVSSFLLSVVVVILPESIEYLTSLNKVSALTTLWGESIPQSLEPFSIVVTLLYLVIGAVITLSVSFPELYRVGAENTYQGRAAVSLLGGKNLAASLPVPEAPESHQEDKPIPTLGLFFLVPLLVYLFVGLFVEDLVYYQVLYLLVLPFCLWIGAATAPIRTNWYKWILPSSWGVLIVLCLIVG